MKSRMKWKRAIPLFLAALFVVTLACGFDSQGQKVYDDAGLLSDAEEQELTALLVEAAKETKQDMIIVTTNDNDGKSTRDYADDFYDDHGFGYEKEQGSGVLLLIDMDAREVYISTAGTAIELYTDAEINDTLDLTAEGLSREDYRGACLSFIEDARGCLLGGETAGTIVEEEAGEKSVWKSVLTPSRLLGNLAVAVLISGIIVFFIARRRKPKMTVTTHTYLKDGDVRFRERSDRFTHTTVIKRRIPKDDNGSGGGISTTHRSSGGVSHGGGGRSF